MVPAPVTVSLVPLNVSGTGDEAEGDRITRGSALCGQSDRVYAIVDQGRRREGDRLRCLADEDAGGDLWCCGVIRVASLIRRNHDGACAGDGQRVSVQRTGTGDDAELDGLPEAPPVAVSVIGETP
jgi:hypothetical protein